ncbi:MAG: exodeoxyribonuclease III [Paludibacteraceae bacterium]|nr:exodeoxyribonuclease III [Paludibacteraceae bacterium]
MKIISYNVNGIRAALSKGLNAWLGDERPDVFCVQETKAQPDQVDLEPFTELGYHVNLNSAQKKGYSGVAVLSLRQPDAVFEGIGIERFDSEGRVLRCDFGDLTVVSVYVPSGSSGDERQEFKMDFLTHFLPYVSQLRKERPNVVICGDFNICHKPIDINHPERQIGVSGFLPEEREWMDLFESTGMIDTFRVFCADKDRYSWWSYRGGARFRNAGWRIDYLWTSDTLRGKLVAGDILDKVVHSDHCPVLLEIEE